MRSMPLGWATDLAILELTGSVVDDRGDYVVVRTPGNPDYHWGHCLLVTDKDAVNDADLWVGTFNAEFPQATWCAVGLPTMPHDIDAWARQGIDLEQLDVLATSTSPRPAPLADGYTVRHLAGDDWETMAERDIADNLSKGEYDPAIHERFVTETMATRRRLCEEGSAAWFGAFSNGDLVSDLGIVRCGRIARYQAVGTHSRHRRRGLASHLLGVAAAWSAERGCDDWVIVTESTNDAGRVYRRAGFALDEAEVNAYRPPPLPAQ
jgi:GNAT superfamily N-acetyltransferase